MCYNGRMTHITIRHPLDWGCHYHLMLAYDTGTRQLSGYIAGPVGSTGTVERHLTTLIALKIEGKPYKFSLDQQLKPSLSVTLSASDGFDIALYLGGNDSEDGELYGRYHIQGEQLQEASVPQRLTIFETRMLGNERLYRWLPYPRDNLGDHLPRTDLHTHSSGQISAQGLIDIACKNHIAYPTRLLDMLHIAYSPEHITSTKRFFFPPTDGGDPDAIPKMEDGVDAATLSDAALASLKAALAIPPDRQMTFGDLEQTIYRYRYPITKHPDTAYDMWHKVAEEYQKQGIAYAEITAVSTSFLTLQNVQFLHEALPKIENETGVALRFLVGIPRSLPAAMLKNEVAKLKTMAASPYIVGIDFMGFEDNKISDLEPYIQSIAPWAHEHDPEFTLRIHAGENRKNMANVKESLRLAEKYHMRVRIGHAAHGLDDDAIAIAESLAKENLVMIEFNPDSNMALNNIDTAEELDMLRCLNKRIPFVICSDGGGLYQTDARQLWTAASFAASFAGVEQGRMESVLQSENNHIEREKARFSNKSQALPKDFFAQIETASAQTPNAPAPTAPLADAIASAFEKHLSKQGIATTPESIKAATDGKQPLMILGATGERYWNMIAAAHKRHIREAIELLVEKLDPRKTYFMIGRPKDEGVTKLLSHAVQKYNKTHSEKFALISATVQADQTKHSFTPGLTHVLPLRGGLFTVPNQLVDYAAQRDGHILFIGGGTFVRDAILVARDTHASFGLMNGPEGASTDKAVMMQINHQFSDAPGLIAHLQTSHPDWFKQSSPPACGGS